MAQRCCDVLVRHAVEITCWYAMVMWHDVAYWCDEILAGNSAVQCVGVVKCLYDTLWKMKIPKQKPAQKCYTK